MWWMAAGFKGITHPLPRAAISKIHGGMERHALRRLSKEQLITWVLALQRPDKNSRTSSKPLSTDKKEKRENSRPGEAKPTNNASEPKLRPWVIQRKVTNGYRAM
jgi:ribosomal protein L19E